MEEAMPASECEICRANLDGRHPIQIGDHTYCSKACADQAQQRQGSEQPQRPPRE
jgi:hypothetical protein